jgi:hypothetical protein
MPSQRSGRLPGRLDVKTRDQLGEGFIREYPAHRASQVEAVELGRTDRLP